MKAIKKHCPKTSSGLDLHDFLVDQESYSAEKQLIVDYCQGGPVIWFEHPEFSMITGYSIGSPAVSMCNRSHFFLGACGR